MNYFPWDKIARKADGKNMTYRAVFDTPQGRRMAWAEDVKPDWVFVTDTAHKDGSFDYFCGSQWCRCNQ